MEAVQTAWESDWFNTVDIVKPLVKEAGMVSRSLATAVLFCLVTLTLTSPAAAQAYAPVVMMSVTAPDGQVHQISAPESGLAVVTTRDGAEYGFRPTMQDDAGTQTVITIFRMQPSPSQLDAVTVKRGASPVATKSAPAFKVAVTGVNKATT